MTKMQLASAFKTKFSQRISLITHSLCTDFKHPQTMFNL